MNDGRNRLVNTVTLQKRQPLDRKSKGFTLIEVMIVVAIIGILSAVAYSSYTRYVTRSSRTDAMEQLNEIMSQQQRFVARQRTYTVSLVTDLGFSASPDNAQWVRTDNGFYNISAAQCACLLYTSPSPRDQRGSRMPSSA